MEFLHHIAHLFTPGGCGENRALMVMLFEGQFAVRQAGAYAKSKVQRIWNRLWASPSSVS